MNNTIDKNIHYGFMPGCSLSSYNPKAVEQTVSYLNGVFPKFSAVLKCCGKPTKDMGQQELFQKRFAGLQKDIRDVGIEVMILACPTCKATFDREDAVPTRSLWEILPIIGLPEELKGKAKDSDMVFTIHDSCSARYDQVLMDGVRWTLNELGYKYKESEYSREHTQCCGFGGQVSTVNPKVTERVMKRRVETLGGLPVVTYCATCRSAFAQSKVQAWHLLDLVWGPVVYAGDHAPENVLETPGNVWHNRFACREAIKSNLR